MDDPVPVGCTGTGLQGLPAIGAGLGQVEQQGGPEATDNPGLGDQHGSQAFGLAKEGCEAGAGDDGKHGSVGVVQARLARLIEILP